MSATVDAVKRLFTGEPAPDSALQQQQAREAREREALALSRQQQELQQQQAERDRDRAAIGRLPRGRRLLLAATGEQGVQRTLG
jgi:hypothetical protein